MFNEIDEYFFFVKTPDLFNKEYPQQSRGILTKTVESHFNLYICKICCKLA